MNFLTCRWGVHPGNDGGGAAGAAPARVGKARLKSDHSRTLFGEVWPVKADWGGARRGSAGMKAGGDEAMPRPAQPAFTFPCRQQRVRRKCARQSRAGEGWVGAASLHPRLSSLRQQMNAVLIGLRAGTLASGRIARSRHAGGDTFSARRKPFALLRARRGIFVSISARRGRFGRAGPDAGWRLDR